MPTITTKRSDILRKPEVLDVLKEAESWLSCLISLAWIFGKRINEMLKVQRDDIWIDGKFLYVRFHVSKKRNRKEHPVPRPYLKRITISHPGVRYIMNYIHTIKEGYIFPASTKPRIKTIKNKATGKVYTYEMEGGHIHGDTALYYLKKLSEKVWWHLFRESLATEMAERGATEEQLMHWFDWDRVDTAHQYVKRGTKLTEELSERTW